MTILTIDARSEARAITFDFVDWCNSLTERQRIKIITRSLQRHAALLKPPPADGRYTRVVNRADQVVAWLRQHGPATSEQIAEAIGITASGFKSLQRRHSNRIVEAGSLPRTGAATPRKLWKAVQSSQ